MVVCSREHNLYEDGSLAASFLHYSIPSSWMPHDIESTPSYTIELANYQSVRETEWEKHQKWVQEMDLSESSKKVSLEKSMKPFGSFWRSLTLAWVRDRKLTFPFHCKIANANTYKTVMTEHFQRHPFMSKCKQLWSQVQKAHNHQSSCASPEQLQWGTSQHIFQEMHFQWSP